MEFFDIVLLTMALLGVVVFVSLYFVDAGYGKMISRAWGPTLPFLFWASSYSSSGVPTRRR